MRTLKSQINSTVYVFKHHQSNTGAGHLPDDWHPSSATAKQTHRRTGGGGGGGVRDHSSVSRNLVIQIANDCDERFTNIQRMLSSDYDFSSLTHPRTVQLTTLETLCYRGLISYYQVILDHINDIHLSLAVC